MGKDKKMDKKSKKEVKVVVDSDSSDSEVVAKKPVKKEKKDKKSKKPVVEDSDSESEVVVKKSSKKDKKKAAKKESSSESESESEEKPAPKKAAKVVAKKESSSESDDESSESEKPKKKAKKDSSSSDDDKSESEAAAPKKEEVVAAPVSDVFVDPEDVGKTEILVRNLSMETWEESIRTMFEAHGALTKCRHLYNKQCAFIEYGTHEEAVKAVAACNGAALDNSNLEVMFTKERKQAESGAVGEANTVFCGNLGFRTTEETIRYFFEQCGEVTTIRIAKDAETDRPRGFAHVEFADPACAAKAVQTLVGQEIEGRAVRLDLS